jgi:hypothetical protein
MTTCPRRIEDGRADPKSPFHDSGPDLDKWREDGTCSYCGSMNPETMLEKAAAGVELIPTDKSYKVYVGSDQRGKFYFQHFDKPQCLKFIELYNAKTLKLGFPGHFYVSPFFMSRA